MPAWTHRITLNSVDITKFTATGSTIEERENASSLANIIYYPASGGQDSDALTLQPVLIEVNIAAAGWQTIFSGLVIRSVWDPTERRYSIRASNRLQEHFRALGSHMAVLSALPGAVYSDALFGEEAEDLWEHAQRCMETIEKDVHLDRAGTLVLFDWAAKGTADHALTAAEIHNAGQLNLDRIQAEELVNRVVVDYQYRVQRKKVRTHRISWRAWNNNTPIDSWCDFMIGPLSGYKFELPRKTGIESLLTDGSWNVPGPIAWSTHPQSASNLCGFTWIWTNTQSLGDYEVTTFGADGYRGFTQSIWEHYIITIDGVAAQGQYGTTVTETKAAVRDVPQSADWPPEKAQPQTTWTVDAIGDSIEDDEDEAARINDLNACYQWGARRAREGNRGHTLTVITDLRPDIGLDSTVSVDVHGMQAKGKVRSITYVLATAPGPRTEIGLAISRGGGGTTDPWAPPARPDSSPGYAPPPAITNLITYVGSYDQAPAPPVPDTRKGWITNVIAGRRTGNNPYETAFRLEWPEIEEEAVQELTPPQQVTFQIAIDQDTLDIT